MSCFVTVLRLEAICSWLFSIYCLIWCVGPAFITCQASRRVSAMCHSSIQCELGILQSIFSFMSAWMVGSDRKRGRALPGHMGPLIPGGQARVRLHFLCPPLWRTGTETYVHRTWMGHFPCWAAASPCHWSLALELDVRGQ